MNSLLSAGAVLGLKSHFASWARTSLLPLLLFFSPQGKSFESPVITKKTPGKSVSIDLDIKGAQELHLEVTDGGDGTSYDWADWAEPRLVGPKGELKLTTLKWRSAQGTVRKNKNYGQGPLKIDGKPVAYGIGTHAKSLISYTLPPGYTRFKARAGLDDGGITQPGSKASVRFHVYTQKQVRKITLPKLTVKKGFEAKFLHTRPSGPGGSWVALGVDAKGRLISSDRNGPLYRITLEDPVKIETLPVEVGGANGFLAAFDSFYVVGKGKGKSGLFRLRDTTGDDQYDTVEHLMSLTVGGDHHAHALLKSPDGKRIYLLAGNNTNLPQNVDVRHIRAQKEDHLLPRSTYYGHNTGRKAPGGFVLSLKPDGSDVHLIAAGLRNAYDFDFNTAGELFTFDADMEYDVGGPWYRPTRINHVISGADFGWRWGAGKWPTWYPDTEPPVVDIGRGSPTGVVFGTGAKFPARYQRALFIADWTYGRLLAVHFEPHGATYRGSFEPFVSGRPLPISDVVVHPNGKLYFVTGGRKTTTHLIEVSYVGTESTAPAPAPARSEARALRHRLEALHGKEDPKSIDVAWPHLASEDRAIRHSARTVIEHQPVGSWIERALSATDPKVVIECGVAAARHGESSLRPRLLEALGRLPARTLPLEQQLDLIRAISLVLIRMGRPLEVQAIIDQFDALYPSKIEPLDHELCKLLLYLDAPKAVERTLDRLDAAPSQSEEMFYAYHLRTIADGWNDDLRKRFYSWLNRAENNRNDYTGGGHFNNFLKMVRREAAKTLKEDEKSRLAAFIEQRETVKPPPPTEKRAVVKDWTFEDLEPALPRVSHGRRFKRGKALYTELCFKCHLMNGQGGAIGPDITSVGNKYSPEALLRELITPSTVISDQYETSLLMLKDGTGVRGRIVSEDKETVRIMTDPLRPEKIDVIKVSDIDKRKVSPVSMMPEKMLTTLTENDVLDLMMYVLAAGRVGDPAFDR